MKHVEEYIFVKVNVAIKFETCERQKKANILLKIKIIETSCLCFQLGLDRAFIKLFCYKVQCSVFGFMVLQKDFLICTIYPIKYLEILLCVYVSIHSLPRFRYWKVTVTLQFFFQQYISFQQPVQTYLMRGDSLHISHHCCASNLQIVCCLMSSVSIMQWVPIFRT